MRVSLKFLAKLHQGAFLLQLRLHLNLGGSYLCPVVTELGNIIDVRVLEPLNDWLALSQA